VLYSRLERGQRDFVVDRRAPPSTKGIVPRRGLSSGYTQHLEPTREKADQRLRANYAAYQREGGPAMKDWLPGVAAVRRVATAGTPTFKPLCDTRSGALYSGPARA
jgi:hypothetical protein